METIVVELEGTLVTEPDPFPYLMLVAFEASGPIRFALLLLVWPVIRLLGLLGLREVGFKLAVFIAVVGVRIAEIEYVGRAVLPKFYMDHIDMDAWRVFSNKYGKKVVVSRSLRVMIERFAKEHLGADQVIGSELIVNRFGHATGLLTDVTKVSSQFQTSCGKESYLKEPLLKDQPLPNNNKCIVPVVFHDGRLVMFPKPAIALLILMWFPIGVVVAVIRMVIALILPSCVLPYTYENLLYGILINVKGNLPKPVLTSDSSSGVLLVCNHRAFIDPFIISTALGRKISTVTYSLSRVTEIIAPIRTLRLTRNRQVDAEMIQNELKQGDTVVCPEGTTCREPFLLRFSALFAELTDQIVPVAVNYKPTFFHSTTARGWKGFDPICFLMNPYSFYEVSFLDQLPIEETCTGGKIPIDVANDVQRRLAVSLGFECTNFTRKDKYMFLNGTDGRV